MMFCLKLLLFISMAVLMLVTTIVTSEVSNGAVIAALYALMAATSFLVSQLLTQGREGILLNFLIQLLAGTAAFMSAFHWIASESDSIGHIKILIITIVTASVAFIVILVLLVHSLMNLSSSAQDRNK